MKIRGRKRLVGELCVPGDKSISHRGIILGALSEGETTISNILLSHDTLCTIDIFRKLGVDIDMDKASNAVKIIGKGLNGLQGCIDELYCGNSGTTMRLLSGVLAGQSFKYKLTGDESLSKRPMDRIINPLTLMGANIKGEKTSYAPISIYPTNNIRGIDYTLPVASAQVKSCIMLASLFTSEETIIRELKTTRNHTELMLEYFGANINYNNETTIIKNPTKLYGKNITVPGDISSAAFFIVAASIVEGSNITLKSVGINPTRTGIITVLKKMGANIELDNIHTINNEEIADINIKYKKLQGTEIQGDIIGTLIDEIPVIAVAATFAEGNTIIRNAEELKHKETDRIAAIATELNKMGANIETLSDGLIIHGCSKLQSATVSSYNDHRIAMALSIAALNTEGTTEVLDADCIDISYPGFYRDLGQLILSI